jgi:uncharacterized CHY-type Zn-finger protein
MNEDTKSLETVKLLDVKCYSCMAVYGRVSCAKPLQAKLLQPSNMLALQKSLVLWEECAPRVEVQRSTRTCNKCVRQ